MWQWGFWYLCIFLSIICPTVPPQFLFPYSFFYFCCLRCLARCKHCSKGPQVPACLKTSKWNTGIICCCCLVTKSCLTLCDPMDCSTLGFMSLTISQSLLKLISIELVTPSTIPSSVTPFSCLQSFTGSGLFPMSLLVALVGQSTGVSASVLQKSIQGWFPLGLTSLILLSKGV